MRESRAWAAGVLSGLLLGVTTIAHGPVYHLHWAIFCGFVPLWSYWLTERDLGKVLFSGWLCQLCFTLVGFHWLAYTLNEFSRMGWALSLLLMLLYCTIGNLQFPLAGFLWHAAFRRSVPVKTIDIATLPLLTALCQRLGTLIFHWNFGYAWLYMGWPGAQLAEIFGFKGLCTLSLCANGLALVAWKAKRPRGVVVPLAAAAVGFLLLNVGGLLLLRALPPPDATTRVLLVQPNTGNHEKKKLLNEAASREASLAALFRLTDQALASLRVPPDFAIWPENAFPGIIPDAKMTFGLTPRLKEYLRKRRLKLLTGAYGFNDRAQITNGLFALSSAGLPISLPYEKRILLPFGEYVPGAERFPILKEWLPDVRDYGQGAGPAILRLGDLKIGAQICYEGLFDSVARETSRSGAQIIVNVTNDSWYGNWLEPWQHLYATMAKAIETRRPILRATNSGVSAVILADGSISELSPVGKEWFQAFDLPYRRDPAPTIFMGWGYWLDWAMILGGLALAVAFRKRSDKRKKESPGAFQPPGHVS